MNGCTDPNNHHHVNPACQCAVSQEWFSMIKRLQETMAGLEEKIGDIAKVKDDLKSCQHGQLQKEATSLKFKVKLTNVAIRKI